MLAGADPAPLRRYATALGLAFQIADDILDVDGRRGQAGKRLGKDAAAGKATFVSLLGLDAAQGRARRPWSMRPAPPWPPTARRRKPCGRRRGLLSRATCESPESGP